MGTDGGRSSGSTFDPRRVLEGSPEAYRLIAENATDVVLLADLDGVYTWASPSISELLGWQVDQVLGRRFSDFLHPDDLATVDAARQAMEPRTALVEPVRFRRADGTYGWVEATARWLHDDAGVIVARVVAMRDVDQREHSRRDVVRSERLFRLLAENSTDVVFEIDHLGSLRFVSPSVQRRLGWRPDELVGTRLGTLIADQDLDIATEYRTRVMNGEVCAPVEIRLRTRSGELRWTSIDAHAIPATEAVPASFVGTLRDCQAEVTLRRAADTLAAATAAMIRAQDESHLLAEMCQVAVDIGGYVFAWYGRRVDDDEQSVVAEASSREHADYVRTIKVSWGDGPLGQGPTGACLREGRPITVSDFFADARYEPWREQATSRGFRSSVSLPVVVDGEMDGAFMVYAAERDAFDEPATARLANLAQQLGYGLRRLRVQRDLGERVKELRLLHRSAQMLGGSRPVDRQLLSELVELVPPAFLYPDDCSARIVHADTECTSRDWAPSPWTLSAKFSTSSGPGRIDVAYAHEHPKAVEGPFLAEERALIDSLAEMMRARIEEEAALTQRRALEEQLWQAQKMDALGTLAGGIAHDFNNILAAIGGNAELALEDLVPGSAAHDALEEILKGHHRARDLVRRILVFSREREPERRPLALDPVVREALDLLRASLPPNIQIVIDVAADLPNVSADATQIHQVVMNLGTNAARAMAGAGGTLTVRLEAGTGVLPDGRADADSRRWVCLRVADTGVGMSPDVQQRIFEPFFTSDRHRGTGLGLAVVDGIVRSHGGVITVHSTPGVGTEFTVSFPAIDASAAPEASSAAGPRRGEGQHIMYVDDEPALVALMTRLLDRLGYRCTGFVDPVEAVETFRGDPHGFDAVVTDLHMAGLSGRQVIAAVRWTRPDVPVALTSGYAFDEDDDPSGDPVTWLRKPATATEVAEVLWGLVHQEHQP